MFSTGECPVAVAILLAVGVRMEASLIECVQVYYSNPEVDLNVAVCWSCAGWTSPGNYL